MNAEGIGPVSFKEHCIPLIDKNTEVLEVLSKFSIEDRGRCLLAMGGPGEGDSGRHFPFVFRAKLRGSTGGLAYYVIIDYMAEASLPVKILGSAPTEPVTRGQRNLGVSIWPIGDRSKDAKDDS